LNLVRLPKPATGWVPQQVIIKTRISPRFGMICEQRRFPDEKSHFIKGTLTASPPLCNAPGGLASKKRTQELRTFLS
jgi:hypothetical protein